MITHTTCSDLTLLMFSTLLYRPICSFQILLSFPYTLWCIF